MIQGPAAIAATLEQIDIVHRMVRKYPDTFELATTAADASASSRPAASPR